MEDKEFDARVEVFQTNLKKLDEKLYYDFLNIYGDYLLKLKNEIECHGQDIEKQSGEIEKHGLKIMKSAQKIHDSDIEIKNEINKLRKEYTTISPEITSRVFDKALQEMDGFYLFVMAHPRLAGLYLLFFGKSSLSKMRKYVDDNRETMKKYKPSGQPDKKGAT